MFFTTFSTVLSTIDLNWFSLVITLLIWVTSDCVFPEIVIPFQNPPVGPLMD